MGIEKPGTLLTELFRLIIKIECVVIIYHGYWNSTGK
jgi:hypothetical protein